MLWWIVAPDTISAHDVSVKILPGFRAEHSCPHHNIFLKKACCVPCCFWVLWRTLFLCGRMKAYAYDSFWAVLQELRCRSTGALFLKTSSMGTSWWMFCPWWCMYWQRSQRRRSRFSWTQIRASNASWNGFCQIFLIGSSSCLLKPWRLPWI